VLCVRWNRDGDYCLTGGTDKTINLWNPHKGTHVKAYAGVHGYDVLDVSITDDSTKFASSGGDKTVFVWDVTSAQVVRRQRGHTERVNTLAWNKEATVLCSGSYDKTVKLWDLRGNTRDPIQTLAEFNDSVSTVLINSEQSQIIAGSVDGKLRQYDMRMGTLVTDHVCQPITSVSLSKDENCILVSCLDATLRLFDRATGELLSSYIGHANTDYKIESCLTNLDAHIVSGSEDHCIYFWSLVEAGVVQKLIGHKKPVISLAYHPKEACLLSASTDGTVICWKDAPPEDSDTKIL